MRRLAGYTQLTICLNVTVTYGQSSVIGFTFTPSSTGTFNGSAAGTMSGGVPWKIKLSGIGVSGSV